MCCDSLPLVPLNVHVNAVSLRLRVNDAGIVRVITIRMS